MSKKKKVTLSEKIADLIAPRRLLDPEIDSEDETAAKTVDFDLEEDNLTNEVTLSDIRKKNIKLLNSVDAKYRGKVASRKDYEGESSEEAEQDEEESEGSEHNEGGSDSEGDLKAKTVTNGHGSTRDYARLKPNLDLIDGGSDNLEDKAESSDEDEGDLKSFTMQLEALPKEISGDKQSSDDDEEDGMDDSESEIDGEEEDFEDEDGEDLDSEHLDEEMDDEEDDDLDEEELDGEEATDEDESDYDADTSYAADTSNKPSKEPSASSILPKAQIQDQLKKGNSVQNQLQIWEKLLEVRIHSQKMLVKANSLPVSVKFKKIFEESAEFATLAKETQKNVDYLLNNMCEIQNILLKNFPETREFSTSKKRKSLNGAQNDDEESKRSRLSDELGESFSKFTGYRNSVISKWYDRTRVLNPGRKSRQLTDFDVVKKIEGVLRNKVELLKKTQLYKGGYELFDVADAIRVPSSEPTHPAASLEGAKALEGEDVTKESANQIYSAEIYDDTDFYHTQLRELIEYKTNTSSNATDMAKQFVELQKLRKKMKKSVDTRASKGRKIRYVVHNKLLNFMAPNDSSTWTNDSKTELFRSLFGAGAQ